MDVAAQRLWGQRVVISTAIPVGVGLLFDPGALHLWMREGARIDVSDTGLGAGDVPLLDLNQTRLRCELRAGSAVLRPRGIVKFDHTA